MTNPTSWTHFKEIIGCIERIKSNVNQLKRDIDQLKSMKETILDDAEFKAKLKMIIDVYPGASMESIVEDYLKFQSLRDWLGENEF